MLHHKTYLTLNIFHSCIQQETVLKKNVQLTEHSQNTSKGAKSEAFIFSFDASEIKKNIITNNFFKNLLIDVEN